MLILYFNKQCINWLITNDYCKGHVFSLNGFGYFHHNIMKDGLFGWLRVGHEIVGLALLYGSRDQGLKANKSTDW